MRPMTKRMIVSVLAVTALGTALAQAEEAGFDPVLWFENPAFGIAAVAGFVEWLRKQFPGIDGPVTVPAVALAVGAIGGGIGQFILDITLLSPFSTFGALGGVAYGLACAATAVLGVNVFELLASKAGKALIGLVRGGGKTVDPDPATTAAHDARLRR